MADVVSKATRSRMMSGIRATNTHPEVAVRKLLFSAGFRYRLNVRSLPGSPDLFFAKHQAAVFMNGCFWHGHECSRFKWPKANAEFWRAKILANRARDSRDVGALLELGVRVATIWECSLCGARRVPANELQRRLTTWLRNPTRKHFEIGEKAQHGTARLRRTSQNHADTRRTTALLQATRRER